MKTVHILMGLPASGKTHWAKEQVKNNTEVKRLDLDKAPSKYTKREEILPRALRSLNDLNRYRTGYHTDLILDGLFLKQEDVEQVLSTMSLYLDISNVIIHYWKEDREACLFNDTNRRSTSSRISIERAELNKPNIKELSSNYTQKITLEEHAIMRKSSYEAFKDTYNLEDILQSDAWSNGGEYGNCWDDSMSSFDADEPLEFEEFDNLLEEINPNMTFLQYKKLKRVCKMKTEEEYGYYGGSESTSYWKVDIKDLYELLLELHVIEG